MRLTGRYRTCVGLIDDEANRGFDVEPAEVDPAPPPPFYICGAYFARIAPTTQLPWHVEWLLWGENATGQL